MTEQHEIFMDVIDTLYKRSSVGLFLSEIPFEENAEGKLVPARIVPVNERLTDRCRAVFKVSNKFIYFILEFEYENDKDLLGMKYEYGMYLDKCTEAFRNNKNVTYDLSLQAYAMDKGYSYKVEAHSPIVCAKDGSSLQFVFDINDFQFGREDIDMSGVDNEIELEKQEAMAEYLSATSDNSEG